MSATGCSILLSDPVEIYFFGNRVFVYRYQAGDEVTLVKGESASKVGVFIRRERNLDAEAGQRGETTHPSTPVGVRPEQGIESSS